MSAAVFGFEYMHVGEEHTSHVMSVLLPVCLEVV